MKHRADAFAPINQSATIVPIATTDSAANDRPMDHSGAGPTGPTANAKRIQRRGGAITSPDGSSVRLAATGRRRPVFEAVSRSAAGGRIIGKGRHVVEVTATGKPCQRTGRANMRNTTTAEAIELRGWLSLEETAEVLGLSPAEVLGLIRCGSIPAATIPVDRIRVNAARLDMLLESGGLAVTHAVG
jgi:hypothetical protein